MTEKPEEPKPNIERRFNLIKRIAFINRHRSMNGLEVVGNWETILTLCVAPEHFLRKTRSFEDVIKTATEYGASEIALSQTQLGICNLEMTDQQMWEVIARDIRRFFPNQFTEEELQWLPTNQS